MQPINYLSKLAWRLKLLPDVSFSRDIGYGFASFRSTILKSGLAGLLLITPVSVLTGAILQVVCSHPKIQNCVHVVMYHWSYLH